MLLKARGYATGAAVSSYVLRGDTGMREMFDFYEDSLNPAAGAAFPCATCPITVRPTWPITPSR